MEMGYWQEGGGGRTEGRGWRADDGEEHGSYPRKALDDRSRERVFIII